MDWCIGDAYSRRDTVCWRVFAITSHESVTLGIGSRLTGSRPSAAAWISTPTGSFSESRMARKSFADRHPGQMSG